MNVAEIPSTIWESDASDIDFKTSIFNKARFVVEILIDDELKAGFWEIRFGGAMKENTINVTIKECNE